MTGWGILSPSSDWPENLIWRGRRTLWVAVWLYIQDEFHSSACFSYLTCFKSKDRNQLISVEDEICVSLSQVWIRIVAEKNEHRFHIKELSFILYFYFKNTVNAYIQTYTWNEYNNVVIWSILEPGCVGVPWGLKNISRVPSGSESWERLKWRFSI